MKYNGIRYIRNCVIVCSEMFFISNLNNSLYAAKIDDPYNVHIVVQICIKDDEWTLYKKDNNTLLFISLRNINIISYDIDKKTQTIISSNNKTNYGFADAMLKGNYVWFLPWQLNNGFCCLNIDDGNIRNIELETGISFEDKESIVYRWNFCDDKIIIVFKNMDYYYEFDIVKEKIRLVAPNIIKNVSDAFILKDKYYIVSEEYNRTIEIYDINNHTSNTITGNGNGGYRKILSDGKVMFFDCDTEMDVLINEELFLTRLSLKHKEEASNFFCVVNVMDKWIFTPWYEDFMAILSNDMKETYIKELVIPMKDVKISKIIYEKDLSLSEYLESIIQ